MQSLNHDVWSISRPSRDALEAILTRSWRILVEDCDDIFVEIPPLSVVEAVGRRGIIEGKMIKVIIKLLIKIRHKRLVVASRASLEGLEILHTS